MHEFPRFDLDGRTALVTGAARGLGRAIALALAHAGADVALGLRDPATGAGLVEEVGALGRRALPLAMDVRNLDQVRAAVDAAATHFGRLDILVNNAGLGPANPAELVTEADFDLTVDVNVKGLFFASQAAARVMIEQGYGRIVNLSSQAGFVALPTEAIYCMTKAAVSHLTRSGRGVGPARHHRQRRGPDVHPHRRHRARPGRPGLPRRRGGAHRGAAPHRRAGRRHGLGGLPRLPRRVPDHRHDPARRRRLDGPMSECIMRYATRHGG
jgi:short subunit dehydrogenase